MQEVRSIRDLSTAVRGRRRDLGLSQSELATRARVSRKWLMEFEGGKPTSELRLVMSVLDALSFRLGLEPKSVEEPTQDAALNLDALLSEYESRDE